MVPKYAVHFVRGKRVAGFRFECMLGWHVKREGGVRCVVSTSKNAKRLRDTKGISFVMYVILLALV